MTETEPERFGFAYIISLASMMAIVLLTLLGENILFGGFIDPLYNSDSIWFLPAVILLIFAPLPLVAAGWGYLCRRVWDAWNVRWGPGARPA